MVYKGTVVNWNFLFIEIFFMNFNDVYKIEKKCAYTAALETYHQTSNISHTFGYNLVDHSDLVGASPVGAVPTTSSISA